MTKSDREFSDQLGVFDAGGAVPHKSREGLGTVREPARDIPVFATTDVLLVGGGPAGTAAAVGAARTGASVVLAERYNHLGGLATGGLVIWIDRMTDWSGNHVIKGVAEELLDRLPKDAILGPPKEHWGSRDESVVKQWDKRYSAFRGVVTWAPMIDPEWLKLETLNMVLESGVDLLLHTWMAAPIVEDGVLKGAIFESKEGRRAVLAKTVVDTTGDGDMYAQSGADYEGDIEGDHIHHCANTAFLWAGVDIPRWFRFQDEEPEGFREFMAKGREETGNFILPMPAWRDDVVVFMGPRFSGFSVTDVDDLTAVEIVSREALVKLLDYYRKAAPGFENAWVMLTAPQLGARHSRRLKGVTMMTGEAWKTGVVHSDEVGISPPLGPNFPNVSVPYGSLLPTEVDNLLVAGRHMATDSQTHTFMREVPQCWLTGHAAGIAAALSVGADVAPRDLEVRGLQSELRKQGAHLRPEEELESVAAE
ncbi:MAG: FAD-dependent oxidoreductase [Alphaproteobacteria bacterium]|jgi:hypothetical protein|nr:FAD-dependent oxidoreductase [Alphaproteobacteria bacterium]